MGRALVRAMQNSAHGLSDKDSSPQAQSARRITGIGDLDGLEFLARIDVGKDTDGDDKNEIRAAITPDHKEYTGLMGIVSSVPKPAGQSTSATTANTGNRPSWAQ
jgi:hypothetical protein